MHPRPDRTNPDPLSFIPANLHLLEVPQVPELQIYTAHPGSRLSRLLTAGGTPASSPYWAYPWAGGIVLARYLLDHPQTVSGKRVLDLGSGSGMVGIAALIAGAASVLAVDIDATATAATTLNAAANGVTVTAVTADLTGGPAPPDIDLLLVGDLFYDARTALAVSAYLERCLLAGLAILVGDPFRAHLPRERLQALLQVQVSDVGSARSRTMTAAGVFRYLPVRSPPQ